MPLSYGNSTGLGGRPSQQDQLLVVDNLFNDPESYLFVILDGHGIINMNLTHFKALKEERLLILQRP